MSVLRYYKIIQDWELPSDNEVLAVIRNATGGQTYISVPTMYNSTSQKS